METVFPFDVDERFNFLFVPIVRKGITFDEMNDTQKLAAFDLLRTCLGAETFNKTKEIMQLETVLKELEMYKPEDHAEIHVIIISLFSESLLLKLFGDGGLRDIISFNFSFSTQTLISGTPDFLDLTLQLC